MLKVTEKCAKNFNGYSRLTLNNYEYYMSAKGDYVKRSYLPSYLNMRFFFVPRLSVLQRPLC